MIASRPLYVYGAGGHGRVVAQAARQSGWDVQGFLDDAPTHPTVMSLPVFEPDDSRLNQAAVALGIGDNAARKLAADRLHHRGVELVTIIHPTAFVCPTATVGHGCFVGPLAVVHTAATLGPGVIINTAAVVEHDCHIAAYAHIAPNAALAGGVTVGEQTLVGLGVTVNPGLSIGRHTTLGAGAAVICHIPDDQTWAGVPARPLE